MAQLNAEWMSGKWGVGYRIPAGGKLYVGVTNWIDNYYITLYDIAGFVDQIKSITDVSWVLVNLSDGAYGDVYMAHHSILTTLNNYSTPEPPAAGEKDFFQQLAEALRAEGIKVIAYMAAQGPAMLKHPTKAYDYKCAQNNGLLVDGEAPSIRRWKDYVNGTYGDTEDSTLTLAYAEIIVDEYAARYNETVDGWWFDQGNYLYGSGWDHTKTIHDIIMTYNPNAVIAFNRGQKSPLTVNSPGAEHYTAGHPEPLKNAYPPDTINFPMIESVEATPDGFLSDGNGNSSLGHVFMPVSNTWNTINSPTGIWPLLQAAEWKDRVLKAGGAWTWNIPRESNNAASLSYLDYDQVSFIKEVESTIYAPSMAPSVSVTLTTSAQPSIAPTKSSSPTVSTFAPSKSHVPTSSIMPSQGPTSSAAPSLAPSQSQSAAPTSSLQPTPAPSSAPSHSQKPTVAHSLGPTLSTYPSIMPTMSLSPTPAPTLSSRPSFVHSGAPSQSQGPTMANSQTPSLSASPSEVPTMSLGPTSTPSQGPTLAHSQTPTLSASPSEAPTVSLGPSPAPTLSTTAPTLSSAPSIAQSVPPSQSQGPTATSSSPSLAPSVVSSDLTHRSMQVTIRSDYYPHETTWQLVDDCDGGAVVIQGGPYSAPGSRRRPRDRFLNITATESLPNSQYTFRIHDSYGDGICCSYGEGSYQVSYDNVIVATGGNFASSEATTFGFCGE